MSKILSSLDIPNFNDPADATAYAAYLEGHIIELEEEVERYRSGYKGACYACEPVGELNLKLESRVKHLENELTAQRSIIAIISDEVKELRRLQELF